MGAYDSAGACLVAEHINGWLAPEEAALLYDVGFHTEGDVLELGTYFGKSTYLMARGIKDAGKPHHVLTIDIHWRGLDPQTHKPLILAEDSPIAVCRTLKDHGLENVVIQMIGWTEHCVPFLSLDSVSTIFIDAGHDYESCRQDFLRIRRQMPRHKRLQLLMHDNSEKFPGVQRAIVELVLPDPRVRRPSTTVSLFRCEVIPEGVGFHARRVVRRLGRSWPLSHLRSLAHQSVNRIG
jgi:hypothetical protein